MNAHGLHLYRLVATPAGKLAVPVDSLEEWYASLGDRRLVIEKIAGQVVSTVFLGIDHAFGCGEPRLFETMIFNRRGRSTDYQERCGTWEEAIEQHERAVAHVMAAVDC